MGIRESLEAVGEMDFDQWCLDNLPLLYEAVLGGDSSNIFDAVQSENPAVTAEDLPVSSGSMSMVCNAGRIYCYTDRRWVTDSDDNYGTSYYQVNESGGTGTSPVVEWEHLGFLAPKGAIVSKFIFAGGSNNTQVTDLEIRLIAKRPNPITRWQTGVDGDGEDTVDVLYSGLFKADHGLTGVGNDLLAVEIPVDYTVPELSFLSVYFRPVGNLTSTRYYRSTWSWQLTLPAAVS